MKLKAEQIFSKGLKIKEDKTNTLVKLLIEFINRAHENDIMPDKKEVSSYLGVSIGTVQNAYRILEDKGLVHSKQRIGTIITSKEFSSKGIFSQSPTIQSTPSRFLDFPTSIILGVISSPV